MDNRTNLDKDRDRPRKIVKQKLFPNNGDNDIWDKLMIDDESVSYISIPEDANKITKIIKQHCNTLKLSTENITITDATSGVGGDIISFANNFGNVNAIEYDATRYKFLANNIETYKLKNVKHYCDDCLNLIYKIDKQDIIFFDPPWGGKFYKNKSNIKLTISNVPLEDICLKLFNDTHTLCIPSLVCLKLPKNYDIKSLYFTLTEKDKMLHVYSYDLVKMYIIVIQRQIK